MSNSFLYGVCDRLTRWLQVYHEIYTLATYVGGLANIELPADSLATSIHALAAVLRSLSWCDVASPIP